MDAEFDPYSKWLGIPRAEQPPHHYRLLGLNLFERDPDVISNAADRQMAYIRGFQIGPRSALSQKILNELSTARLCLLVEPKKAAYDAQLLVAIRARQEPVAVGLSWQDYLLGVQGYLWCQWRRFYVSSLDLPQAHRRLGESALAERRYRERLSAWYSELDAGAAELAALSGPPPLPDAPLPQSWSAKAKCWGSNLLRGLRKRTLRRRRGRLLICLGASAYDIDGVLSGPSELTAAIQDARLTLDRLRAEVLKYRQPPPGLWLSPARLVWLVAGTMLGLSLFLGWLRWMMR